jgi:hypothetical protein
VSGNTSIGPTISGDYLAAPLIDADGAMLFDTIERSPGWLTNMNSNNYAGSEKWKLPTLADIEYLYKYLSLVVATLVLKLTRRLDSFTTFSLVSAGLASGIKRAIVSLPAIPVCIRASAPTERSSSIASTSIMDSKAPISTPRSFT